MKHPYELLKAEYATRLAAMTIVRREEVTATAQRLLGNMRYYQPVSAKTGIPVIWIAASFEREASSDFRRSPAQGDFYNRVSTHVPKGRGPFKTWEEAALDAYHLNALDKVGKDGWSWELMCFYGELFNGFGYRDFHHMPSPYLWAGTNQQQRGKYTADGKFDASHYDTQLGIVPIMRRMVELDGSLAVRNSIAQPASAAALVVQPAPAGVGSATPKHTVRWIQERLNAAGYGPVLDLDGSYGRETWLACRNFQIKRGLLIDGFAGPETIGELETVNLDSAKDTVT